MAQRSQYKLTRWDTVHERARPWLDKPAARRRDLAPATAPDAERAAYAGSHTETDTAAPLVEAGPDVSSAGKPVLAIIFMLSLMLPITIQIGPLLLFPYRLVLLVLFFPLFFKYIKLRLYSFDWLMMFSVAWALLALAVHHPLGQVFETMGIYTVEIFGAYMLGRVAIRSGEDFRKLAKVMVAIVIILTPLAVAEAVLNRPIALDLIPGSIGPVNIGQRFGLRRAQTLFSHPIHHGAFASTVLGLAWFAVSYRSGLGIRFLRSIIVIICTAMSLSSAALFSLVFQCIFIIWEVIMHQVRKRWTIFAILSALTYVLIDLAATRTPFHVVVNYATFSSGSAYNRILIWNFGTQNVADNPLFGIGLNDWERPRWMSSSVDNHWLLVTMKYGLPAGLAYIFSFLMILRRVSLAELINPIDRASRAGYLVSFGGLAMAGATVHYWHGIGSFAVLFFASGAWAVDVGMRRLAETDAATAGSPATVADEQQGSATDARSRHRP